MVGKTKIEWTEYTWNPVRGCTKVSDGCDNCYAMRQAARMDHPGGAYEGLTRKLNGRPQWNGKVKLVPELLVQPLRWTKPRMIFVNSMSDLFHPGVPDEFIDRVFAVMALATQHTFQILTKRPLRMRNYVSGLDQTLNAPLSVIQESSIARAIFEMSVSRGDPLPQNAILMMLGSGRWPLPNVWLGISTEDQATANERVPLLLDTPAAVRWVSCEPLLGAVDLSDMRTRDGLQYNALTAWIDPGTDPLTRRIDWIVVGGESGPGSRPMHPDWARSLRDQCQAATASFLFKQWGDWLPSDQYSADGVSAPMIEADVHKWPKAKPLGPPHFGMDYSVRAGKKVAGRALDGRIWDEYPATESEEAA